MTRIEEAIAIAADFNWAPEMPDVVSQLRQGIIPDGFGRLVGQTIALFLQRPVIGPWKTESYCRSIARRLARLRLLIAEIRLGRK
jgi:hypothetical protein